MKFPQEQIDALKGDFGNLSYFEEGNKPYFLIQQAKLPENCTPVEQDILLCPAERDGYSSRLFFSEQVKTKAKLNWNANGVRIGERNWHAYSYKVPAGLTLSQLVAAHMGALTR